MTSNGVIENFAQDLPLPDRQVLAATQAPTNGAAFGASHYRRVASETHLVCGGQQRSHDPARVEMHFATAMNAKTLTLPASHVPMLSHPSEVAR